MPQTEQLSLIEDVMAVVELAQDPGADYGEVFTRRWVVELILDLVGYMPDSDLGSRTLIEPSCGTGAFLVPIVERLLTSSARHGRDIDSLGPAIRAFDVLDVNAQRARKTIADLLKSRGVGVIQSEALASEWVTTDDFLLSRHVQDGADFVVGNPPYIRIENVPRHTMVAYRRLLHTMRGRADIYVGFIERGLSLLRPGGALAFICADRWMRNQYGADLRQLISSRYAVDTIISMHEVDAFEDDVSAYPAIVVLKNETQGHATVIDADERFNATEAAVLTSWIREDSQPTITAKSFDATRLYGWFAGNHLWPAGSPKNLALLSDLESRFAPLQDQSTGTVVGIGLATGCDDVYLNTDEDAVEPGRLLPVVRASDISTGEVHWNGTYLINPWDDDGLVDLGRFPRLRSYFNDNEMRLRDRYIARRRPEQWYRTIDRVNPSLTTRPKLLLPDMKAAAHPVLDEGGHYPHHNLYVVTSEAWDLEVLGGVLLSDFANLFVGAYCVRMRGGCYRFQAQYLRTIRVPDIGAFNVTSRRAMRSAFAQRDVERATAIAATVYGVSPPDIR